MPDTRRHRTPLGATLAGIRDRLGRRDGLVLGDQRLDGLHCLVTGANRGLGKAIATGLAERGGIVHAACRSLLDETIADVGAHGEVRGHRLDLADPRSVDGLVRRLADDGVRLDRVILNAGVVPRSSRTTPAGLDILVHVNFLANVQLVDGLLAAGVLVPADPPPRVIAVGSESHRDAPIRLDLDAPRTYGTRQVVAEYGASKALLHAWTVELGRRLWADEGPRVGVHHLCPGAVASGIAREAPALVRPPLDVAMKLFFQSPEQAAVPILWLCTAPELDERTLCYLHMREEKAPADAVADPPTGAALWDAAHEVLATLETP